MNLLFAAAPGELADWEPEPESWEWEDEMRRCIICGDDRDVEWTEAGYGCRQWRACERRFLAQMKDKETPHTATPASTAA